MIKHKIFVGLTTLLIIALIIAVIKLPNTLNYKCTVDSDCQDSSECIDGFCQNLVKISCQDPDYKNIYQQSTSMLVFEYTKTNLSEIKEDMCLDNQTLIEWFCDGNTLKNQTIKCGFNCSQGKCLYNSKINGTDISSLESLIPLTDYNLSDLAIKVDDITHDNTNGYNYVFLTLTDSSGLKAYETKKIRVGSFAVFKAEDHFIKISVPGIHADAESLSSAVQMKIDIGEEYAQYYNSTT